jgi:hypothetical protein
MNKETFPASPEPFVIIARDRLQKLVPPIPDRPAWIDHRVQMECEGKIQNFIVVDAENQGDLVKLFLMPVLA